MRIRFLLCLLAFTGVASAQDITGIWRGSFYSTGKLMDMFEIEDRYKLEVQLDQHDKAFEGVTYSYKTTIFYGKATASGTISAQTGKVKMMELKLVEVKMQQGSSACIMTYSLQYKKSGNEEFLEGTYTSFNEAESTPCGKGTVVLRKVTTSDFHKEPFLVRREEERRKKGPPVVVKKKPVTPVTKSPATASGNKPAGPVTKSPSTDAGNKPAEPVAKTPSLKSPAGSTGKPPVIQKPAIAKNTAPKPTTKPPVANSAPKPVNPRPLENKAIPDIVKADSPRSQASAIRKPVMIPKVLTTRENELVKTISVSSNIVSINIYDNGTIDHDTVSVYLDNKLIVSKQMLTTTPIKVQFEMNDLNAVHELVMVAENLGDFPPNTSLMVVRAGDKTYEVRITSTEQKHAVVNFRYEKK